MKVIGIIGGVGSGKSEITKYISKHFKACVIIADQVGHEVLEKDSPAYGVIVDYFGTTILDEHQNIDRKMLGNIVFKDKKSLDWLNKTAHPLIYNKVTDKIYEAKNNQAYELIVFEAAIMVEAHWLNLVDYVWLITCSETVRIERLMKNRHLPEEKIKNIIANQQSDQILGEYADTIIDNSFDREKTFHQVYIETLKVLEAKNENK